MQLSKIQIWEYLWLLNARKMQIMFSLHRSVYLNGVDVSYYLLGCTLDAVKIDPLKKFYQIKSSTNSDVGINLRKIGKKLRSFVIFMHWVTLNSELRQLYFVITSCPCFFVSLHVCAVMYNHLQSQNGSMTMNSLVIDVLAALLLCFFTSVCIHV